MDERIKSIRHLNEERAAIKHSKELLAASLGAGILERFVSGEEDAAAGLGAELKTYARLTQKLTTAREKLDTVEKQTARLRYLETELLKLKREQAAKMKAAAPVYAELGRAVMEAGSIPEPVKQYRVQAETLFTKIRLAEERKAQLDEEGGRTGRGAGGIFAAAGRSLHKARENTAIRKAMSELNGIYTNLGQALPSLTLPPDGMEESVRKLFESAIAVNAEIAALKNDAADKKNEAEQIGRQWKMKDGGGKTSALKQDISLLNDEKNRLCVKTGLDIANVQNKDIYNHILNTNDLFLVEAIQNEDEKVSEIQDKIKKLESSLEIDIKQTQIDKLEKQINDKRMQISKHESDIMDIEKKKLIINKEMIRIAEGG
jgi:hypothetical protein